MQKSTRNENIDILKALMALMIIITHSAFASYYRENPFFPLVVDMAVPVFMIVSGYVNTQVYRNDYYSQKTLFRKICRIIIPFLPIAVLEIAYWSYKKIALTGLVANIIFQAYGPGGYYPIIMIEFIVVFPIILKLSENKTGCVTVLAIDVIFEIISTYGSKIEGTLGTIVISIHRMCIFRYLGFILVGVLLYKNKDKVKIKTVIVLAMTGLFAVWMLDYIIDSYIIFGLWRSTSLPVVLWALSWVMLVLIMPQSEGKGRIVKRIGRSSYCIFLVQMIYYYAISEGIFVEPKLLVSVIICTVIGVLYSTLDEKIQKTLIRA